MITKQNWSLKFSVLIFCLLLNTLAIQAQDTETPVAVPTETPTEIIPTPTATLTETAAETPTETLAPTSEATVEITQEPAAATPTEQPGETEVVPPTDVPTGIPTPVSTALPAIPAEPAMQLLVNETLDNGDLSPWGLGAGWSLAASEGGFALQVINSSEMTRFITWPFFNAAAQARFQWDSGSAQLSVRQSQVGSYTAVLDASGAVQLLRVGQPLAITVAPTAAPDAWRTLRLSAVDDVIRVAVDGLEVIAVRDDAPLPPGEVALSALLPQTGGQMQVDDLAVWVPQTEYGMYPQPTPVVPTAIPPTLTPTTDLPPATPLPPTSTPTAPIPVTEEITAEALLPEVTEVVSEATAEATDVVDESGKLTQDVLPPSAEQLLNALASGNNNFASAVTIQSTYPNNSDDGDTTTATLETNEDLPIGCGFNVGRTVWFTFTPSSNGNYIFSLAGSEFDTVLAVYTGTSVSSLTQIGCNDDASAKVLTSMLTLNGLTAGTTYRIQIGGYQQDFGLYDLTVQRSGVAVAGKPVLALPASGATTVDQTPTFTWNAAANALAYEIQIATDKNFSNVVSSAVVSALNFTPASNLNTGLHYWRVRGLNSNAAFGAFSTARTFTIKTTPPNQVAPAVNAIVTSVHPLFTFAAFGAGATYAIQFSDTNNFAGDVDFTLNCSTTRCAPTAFSLHQGQWHWRLQAIDSQGNPTPFGGSRPFSVSLLQTPKANALFTTAGSTNVAFKWYAAAGATGYTLQIDDNAGFGSPDSYNPSVATATTLTVTGLGPDNYFWRVLVNGLDTNPALVPSYAFTVSPAAPVAPILTSPNNGATAANPEPLLNWEDYTGAGGPPFTYNIDICSTSRCAPASSIVESATGLSTSEYIVANPLPTGPNGAAKTYYWRVQTVNSLGVKGAFASRSLTIRTAPPELVSPAHESSNPNPLPVLKWKAYPGATYDIQIASDELFNNIVVTQTGLTTIQFTPPTPLTEDSYFWRVRALDGTAVPTTTAYSLPRKFTVGPIPPPAPALVSPNQNAVTADQTPAFDWSDVIGAATYCLLLDNQANFSSPEISTCAPATSQFTPVSLLDAGIYFWKVRSVNNLDGAGAYSPARRVTIQTNGPALTGPADGATITDTTPALTWAIYAGSTLYNLRIDTDAACDSSIGAFSSPTNSFTPPILVQGTYFWCVQARDALNTLTTFGPVRSFTINILSKPAQNAVTPDTTPTFQWIAATAGARYCLDVDNDDQFEANDPIFLTVCDLTTTSHTPALANGIWYWRVRVSTDGGTTYQPATPPFRKLTISPAAPAAPKLNLPGNGAVIWTTNPLLSWKPSASGSPVEYLVEVDTDPKFASPDVTTTLPAASCTTTLCSLAVGPFALDTTFYWRVRARNAFDVESKVSAARFRIQNPVDPTLTAPANNTSTTTSLPIFKWTKPVGAVRFDIRLDTEETPALTPGVNLTANTFKPVAPLVTTTYYWQVQAYDSLGTPSGWSPVFSLKITTPTTGAPLPNRFGPGSTNAPHTVRLSWGPISWVYPGGWYEVMIDDHATFASPLFQTPNNASVLPGGTQTIQEGIGGFPILPNGTFYWRVRACDSTGRCGSWSSRGTFVVDR